MRIVFFGCDDFAAINLERLIQDRHKVVGLVTRPDKPKGRGLRVAYSPTKQLAFANGIAVFQPDTLRNPAFVEKIAWFQADVFVVVAYGNFLPPEVLGLPRHFCVNVHASLLPKYRGAAPINFAIMNGEERTGVTVMKVNEKMDAGDIIAQESCAIPEEMTSSVLRLQLAHMGAKLLSETLPRIKAGQYSLQQQDEALVTHAPKMHKDLGHIRWDRTAKEIHDLVRGVQPWPGAFTFWRQKRLKILDAVASSAGRKGQVGEIVELHKDGFLVQASDGLVLIRRVHLENSHAMDARSFLAGHRLTPGEMLG